MTKDEFSNLRSLLGKTQKGMAELLGTSKKSVEAFEQGWREVPAHVERQALFLLYCLSSRRRKLGSCWETQGCSLEICRKCPAWEYQVGDLCWFINGTICRGEVQSNWGQKMKICRKCKVFRSMFPEMS